MIVILLSTPPLFRHTLFSFLGCAFLVTLCYAWADPLITLWVNEHHFQQFLVLKYCTYLANVTVWATMLYYLYFMVSFAMRRDTIKRDPSSKWPFLNVANSVAIAIFIKDALKFVFGRYWPNTWVNNNPSLLHDHAYGFHFFHSGTAYTSFPSGHTTIVVAAVAALWITYPRGPLHWLAFVGALAVIIGLIGENFHFLGDCIAGIWIGIIVALYVTAYSKQRAVSGQGNIHLADESVSIKVI